MNKNKLKKHFKCLKVNKSVIFYKCFEENDTYTYISRILLKNQLKI